MPATEETYRSQPTLHVVFAVSSIAMLLSIVWMIAADHFRPWKQYQREFHRIEDAKLKASEDEKLAEQKAKNQAAIEAIDRKIEEAARTREANSSRLRELDREINLVGGRFEDLDTRKRFMKAELDSQRSLYDGMIDRGEERKALTYLSTTVDDTEQKLLDISIEHQVVEKDLAAKKAEREHLLGDVDSLVKEREKLTREADRVRRVIEQKERQYFGITAWIRGLPGLDVVPPTKIQQISLPDLTINYNFKDVPRYDRCTTCHQGIDRIGYDTDDQGGSMKAVFASHPHLTDGATTVDPRGNVVTAGLYLDANGPHPINDLGCTICHGGQGSGTDFTFSSHTPNDLHQKEHWESQYNWHEIHHWDEPMLPARFMESSCVKCHHQVTDVPQAKKLQAGYERVVKFGCTGCHQIGGEGSFGPDLTEERAVGPNLTHIGAKLPKDWTLRWIKNPHAFRPDSRMPRFYGVTNNNAQHDWPKNHAEIHAITHYLYAKSTPPAGFVDAPAKNDPAHGKELFLQKGCLACHSHRPYETADLQLADRDHANPKYKHEKGDTFDPSGFPESVRDYAKADYGPNLIDIAAKFSSRDQGYKWLTNWIKTPESYHPRSLMPNLQLSLQDSADIAAWILTIPGEWPVKVEMPAVDSAEVEEGLNELVALYVRKGGFALGDRHESVPLSEIDEFVTKKLSRDDKLMFLGQKTISRLGCFGCHNIPGFETAKPIGTPLNGWGIKSPAKLDFAHISEYLQDQALGEDGERDGTDEYYHEKLVEHTRTGFLYQKLHRPRSYDYKKTREELKTWDERLRMPQFAWANDPAAVEEVMTFILGLTGEKIASKFLPKSHYTPRQTAIAEGSKLLNRYNCTGCHVLEMPKYVVAAKTPLSDAFTDFKTNLRASYSNRGTDYVEAFYPNFKYDANANLDPDQIEKTLGLTDEKEATAKPIAIEGMAIGQFENELTVQLWRPLTIRGYTFNVGDTLTLDKTKVKFTPPEGGNFAWLFSTYVAERTGGEFSALWNRLPPPLLREGLKVQTPWLTSFLKDPYAIRPAVNLRMPQFHYGRSEAVAAHETAGLANFFAAHDGAEFPYQIIPERTQAYLSEREAKHPDYFGSAWSMLTTKTSPCLSCHAVGPYKPTGGAEVVNGPDLRQVGPRFRSEFLEEWLAKPSRLVPFTAMPQNIVPHGALQMPVPKTFENQPLDMVRAIRDTLLNYSVAVEQQLAVNPGANSTPAPAAPGGSE